MAPLLVGAFLYVLRMLKKYGSNYSMGVYYPCFRFLVRRLLRPAMRWGKEC